MSNEARVLDRLDDLGYRLTSARRAVVRTAYARSETFSADDLYDELRSAGSGVGRATVFRTLDLLVGLRLLDRVHRPDGSHGYVAGGPGHRHHLTCSTCGTVVEFHDCNVSDLVDQLARRTDFQIDGHWLEFFGTCPDCRQATA